MKKFTLLFLIFAIFTQMGFSQDDDYVPMLGNNTAGWYQYVDLGEVGGVTTLTVYIDGDTTVNNTTYKQLKYDWYMVDDDSTYTNLALGSYREDVSERKVYSLNSSSDPNQEKVIYDFSKSEGDTVRLGVNLVLVVDSITHDLQVCGQDMGSDVRVFHLTDVSNDEPIIWVEGIGSLAGLQANASSLDCERLGEGLICKMSDDEIIYHFNGFDEFNECPFEVTSSNQKAPEKLTLRLFPNPVHSTLRISGDPTEIGNARYRIYNITGQELRSGYLDYSSESSIDVSTFRSGAYIMEIYNKEKHLLTNKKFVIAN